MRALQKSRKPHFDDFANAKKNAEHEWNEMGAIWMPYSMNNYFPFSVRSLFYSQIFVEVLMYVILFLNLKINF